jgi:hypothetical protein
MFQQGPQAPAPATPGGPASGSSSGVAAHLAEATAALAREGITPENLSAIKGFFLTLQQMHASANQPAPTGATTVTEQLGYSALPSAAAQNAPPIRGRI